MGARQSAGRGNEKTRQAPAGRRGSEGRVPAVAPCTRWLAGDRVRGDRYLTEAGNCSTIPRPRTCGPRLDYESHAIGLGRNELGALPVAAGLGRPAEHMLWPGPHLPGPQRHLYRRRLRRRSCPVGHRRHGRCPPGRGLRPGGPAPRTPTANAGPAQETADLRGSCCMNAASATRAVRSLCERRQSSMSRYSGCRIRYAGDRSS